MAFVIYTTGLYNWGNTELIEFWNSSFCNHVLLQLDVNPESVTIVHYDPMFECPPEKRERFVARTKKMLSEGIVSGGDGSEGVKRLRVNQVFLDEPLPVEALAMDDRPHLIIDCAHIFVYSEDGIPIILDQDQSGTMYPELRVVYPGYLGIEDGNKKNRDLVMSQHFITPEYSYIDLILLCFGKLHTTDDISTTPFNDVAVAVEQAKRKIIAAWRSKYGIVDHEYDNFISIVLTVNKVLGILKESKNKDAFIDRVASSCIALI